MRTNLLPLALSLMTTAVTAQEARVREAIKTNESIVWAGLDYSLMRMIGNSNTIRVPDMLFQDMPARWNELFLDERIEGVARTLKTRIRIDLDAVTARNKELSPNQVLLSGDTKEAVSESHITPGDIAREVQSYKMRNTKGLGAVFIVDRFVYVRVPGQMDRKSPGYMQYSGAAYVVFFDIATREVLSARREVRNVGKGGGFRNFWFGPIKDIDEDLGRYRQ